MRGRTWWRAIGSVVAVVFLASIVLQLLSVLSRSSETVRTVHPAEGVVRLQVDDPDGDVRVTGTDRDDILVVSRISHGLQRTRTRLELRDGVLVASSSCPLPAGSCWVDYRIEVPRDLDVTVHTGNGDVQADSLQGVVRLDSSNGDVRLREGSAAEVHATSRNGDVTLDLREAPSRVLAESSNGDVEVRVPRSRHSYDLELDTDNGGRFGEVRTDPDSDRELVVRSRNGDVTVGYRSP